MTAKPTDQQPEAVTLTTEQASTNFYWTLGNENVFNLQTTIRSSLTDEQIAAHVDTVIRTLRHIVSKEGRAKAVGIGSNGKGVVTEAQPTSQLRPAPGKKISTSSPVTTKPLQSFHCKLIEVTPKPDGKAEIKFYADGHKYPDIYATRTIEQWIDMLIEVGEWQVGDFQVAAQYDCDYKVNWNESEKLNKNGKPYHDLHSIQLVS